jgi:hypothetical protein
VERLHSAARFTLVATRDLAGDTLESWSRAT